MTADTETPNPLIRQTELNCPLCNTVQDKACVHTHTRCAYIGMSLPHELKLHNKIMEIQLTQKQIEKCKRNKNTTKSQELECSHQ